jgi:hypothetical protein
MELSRHRLDALAFAAALAALGAATLWFFAERNGAAVVMCSILLSGLVAGRLVRVPGRVLLPVALGLAVILWMVWVDPPAGPHKTSALAHAGGGALAGWALATTLRARLSWPASAFAAIVGVLVLAGVWEVAEWVGDRALDTALIPNRRDSALDMFFGGIGGLFGVALAAAVAPRGARRR